MTAQRLRLWQDTVETDVEVLGSGPPLVFLHGPWGLPADLPFVERLAETNTVYAPRHPGTTRGDPDAIHRIDTLYDLVVYHAELFQRLDLRSVPLVGHSVGAMLACEIAATRPDSVSALVLIAPVGLWRDEEPVRNWMILSDDVRRTALFAQPQGAAAQRFFARPDDRAARAETQANVVWAQACTAKFVWPVPDKGLEHRIHRVSASSLIVWGTRDGIIAASYADEFAKRLPRAQVEHIDDAGHLPHLEQTPTVERLVHDFLTREGAPTGSTASIMGGYGR